MVGYNSTDNALTLGDDDSLKVGDYEVEYSADSDEFQARYGRPIGGENGFHADLNSPSYEKPGIVGEYGLRFDDQDIMIVESNNIDIFNSFDEATISFWFHPEYIPDDAPIFQSYGVDGENVRVVVVYEDGELQCGYRDGTSTWVTSSMGVDTDDSLQHVTATFDFVGGTVSIYKDGVDVSSAGSSTLNTSTSGEGGKDLVGGATTGTVDEGIRGLLDDIRVYNRVLSSSDITDLYNKEEVSTDLVVHWTFEYPETTNLAIDSAGDVYPKNSIPRSTSDSLVPDGLAESVSAGEALADDGNTYASVQDAVSAASGWVFVGPGTFNESVDISTAGLMIEGCGEDTLIDGGGIGNAISASVDNLTIANLSVQTTGGGYDAVELTNSSNSTVRKVHVRQADSYGIDSGPGTQIVSCVIESTFASFISRNDNIIVKNCVMRNTSVSGGIGGGGDNEIIANNIIEDTDGAGIGTSNNDGIIVGNRIINSGEAGIILSSTNDYIVANNRISDSTNSDINDGGAGTVLDDNLTGPSN